MTKYKLFTSFALVIVLMFLATAAFAVPNTINYQGYLESGGAPVNGTVSMTFKIYNAASGGSALWTETQSSVAVTDGAFSVVLGSLASLTTLPFDEQYYLGVNVDGDGEMAPRAVLVSVPYAMRAKEVDNAPAHVHSGSDITSGMVSATFLNTTVEVQRRVAESCAPGYMIRAIEETGGVACEFDDNTTYTPGTGINIVGNQINNIGDTNPSDDLTTGTIFSGDVTGTYNNLNIAAGAVSSSKIAPPISLNASSALATITGTGSSTGSGVKGVNTSTGYGVEGINTNTGYGVAGTSTGFNNFGYLGTDYDGVVGTSNRAGGYGVWGTSDNGFGVYGQSSTGRAVYGNTGSGYAIYGNSDAAGYGLYTPDRAYVGGDLELAGGTTSKVTYATPRTHYYTVGGEGFVPWNNSLDYENTGGFGGAFILTGNGYMVHAVDLPQGAQITNLKVYFDDTSASYDVSVSLKRMALATGSYGNLGSVTSSGATGNQNGNIGISHTVDKLTNSYFLEAYCSNWQNASTVVMGAIITYTISEAP